MGSIRIRTIGDTEIFADFAPFNVSAYHEGVFDSGSVKLVFESVNNVTKKAETILLEKDVSINDGGRYTFVLRSGPASSVVGDFYEDAGGNQINIFWQLPQYFVLTCGEILFSVTGELCVCVCVCVCLCPCLPV